MSMSDSLVQQMVDIEPFDLFWPTTCHSPLFIASPHSGRTYPSCFLEQSRLNQATLRRSEDFCVDKLYDFVIQSGVPFLKANFPRSFVDVNRSSTEIDPTLLFDGDTQETAAMSRRVANGLGVVPRIVGAGIEIYADPIGLKQISQRIRQFHTPYHKAVETSLAKLREHFGAALLIDCHSMPDTVLTRRLSSGKSSDIVLGDRYGASCDQAVVDAAEACLKRLGYRVTRNDPYAGGYITQRYGTPSTGLHALQIEINRRLYMDERKLRLTAGFDALRSNLQVFIAEMRGVTEQLPRFDTPAFAAE